MVPAQKNSKRKRKRSRFDSYTPADFEQRVPFTVRRLEEDEESEEEKRNSLAEAVKIHWTRRGESEEELNLVESSVFDDDGEEEKKENLNELTESSIGSFSLMSSNGDSEVDQKLQTILEADSETKWELYTENKSGVESTVKSEVESTVKTEVESEAKWQVESVENLEIESEAKFEVESETKWELESVAKSEIDSETKSEIDSESKSGIDSETKWEEESERKWEMESVVKSEVESMEKSEIESEVKWEIESMSQSQEVSGPKSESGDVMTYFSSEDTDRSEELIFETEEIKLELVGAPAKQGSEDEEEKEPSFTWLLGPTSDEVILDAVHFFAQIINFVKDPVGFDYSSRCCKNKLHSSDACDGEE